MVHPRFLLCVARPALRVCDNLVNCEVVSRILGFWLVFWVKTPHITSLDGIVKQKKSVELVMAGGPACELFSRLSSSWNVELSTVCHKMSRIFLWTDFSLGHQISTNIYIYTLSLYIQNTYIVEFICICMYFLFILKSKFPTTVATSKPRRKLTPSKWIWWSHQKLEKIWWVGWGWCLVFWEMVRENANNAGNPPKKAEKPTRQNNSATNKWFFDLRNTFFQINEANFATGSGGRRSTLSAWNHI